MDFVALDFETANEKRNSVCAIGLCVVDGGKITRNVQKLVCPKGGNVFKFFNTMIHGIKFQDVKREPEFPEVWEKLKPFWEGRALVCHNAGFDISVLRAVCDTYGLTYPDCQYLCTLVASKAHYKNLDNHRLDTIAAHLGYSFNHHCAKDDAAVSAKVLIKVAEELGAISLIEIADSLGFNIGRLSSGAYTPCGVKPKARRFVKP